MTGRELIIKALNNEELPRVPRAAHRLQRRRTSSGRGQTVQQSD